MKLFLTLLFTCTFFCVSAGSIVVTGVIKDEKGNPLAGVSIALLEPLDSTLSTFGITNKQGVFQIKDASAGKYVLQAAGTGYFTEYVALTITGTSPVVVNTITLHDNLAAKNMNEVVVSGEKVPVRIKGDTVEYNAGSFKVKPNAPVEELLRQLPGMQLDEAGNIKSMGKNVNKVLVDGKEFFGNDPKVATKNLPADAVSRVQTFGKKSDQSEFSGIDDGQRDQTINLVLKDNKKTGYFGDAHLGGGTDDRFDAGIKAFRFQKKTQMAAIGQFNNINQTGFSFTDYMNFNGGLGGLMSGGGRFSMNGDDDMLNFGQTVSGDITSGAVGLNYSYEARKGNRFNISYMGSGTHKLVDNTTSSQNFLPGTGKYETDQTDHSTTNSIANRLSLKWRNEFDSVNQLIMEGKAQLKNNDATASSVSMSYIDASLQNRLDDNTAAKGQSVDVSGSLGLVHKMNKGWKLFQLKGELAYSQSINKSNWQNLTRFYSTNTDVSNSQFQDDDNSKLNTGITASITRHLGNNIYLEPGIKGYYRKDVLNRDQGNYPVGESIDSLSPHFYNNIYTVFPGLALKKSTSKTQWNVGLEAELMSMSPVTNQHAASTRTYQYLLPAVFWRKDLAGHKSLNAEYSTSITAPATNQLLPVTYYSSPLSSITGNLDLKPEYTHNFNVSYHHFDEFNMASLFAYASGSYTMNNINTARTIDQNLGQHTVWVNTPYEGRLTINASYGKPIKKLRTNFDLSFNETIASSVSPINGVDNKTTSLSHELTLRLSNRKNAIWNIRAEGSIRITDASYSVNKEQNNTFYNYKGSGVIGFTPRNSKWFTQLSADVTHYTAKSFDQAITVPLLKAEVSRYLFANNRGTLTLRGYDLLDKNKSVTRTSQMNYLVERRTNVIGRYVMLSFTYKLTKAGNKTAHGGIMIQ